MAGAPWRTEGIRHDHELFVMYEVPNVDQAALWGSVRSVKTGVNRRTHMIEPKYQREL